MLATWNKNVEILIEKKKLLISSLFTETKPQMGVQSITTTRADPGRDTK